MLGTLILKARMFLIDLFCKDELRFAKLIKKSHKAERKDA